MFDEEEELLYIERRKRREAQMKVVLMRNAFVKSIFIMVSLLIVFALCLFMLL